VQDVADVADEAFAEPHNAVEWNIAHGTSLQPPPLRKGTPHRN
jgi:hypothetical protein